MTNFGTQNFLHYLVLVVFHGGKDAMGQLLVRQPLLQITRTRAAVDNHVIISCRNTLNRHAQQLMGLLGIRLGRVERAQVLLLERVVQLIHQILELDVRRALVRVDVLSKHRRVANLANRLVLARIVADKILFTRIRHSLIKRRCPADDTVLVNMDAGELRLLQALNQTRHGKLVLTIRVLLVVCAANEPSI